MLLEELPLELPPLILRPLCVASSEVERYLAMSSNELGDLVAISESESTISSPSRYHLVTPRHHLVTISSPSRHHLVTPRHHLVTISSASRQHLVFRGAPQRPSERECRVAGRQR